jgi:hypothetical protein
MYANARIIAQMEAKLCCEDYEQDAHLSNMRLQRKLCLNRLMFARKIRVEYEAEGRKLPCPLKWLDSFSMRNFTNATAFDDTLPVADGQMEIGSSVSLEQLKEAMEDWFRRKGYLPKDSHLSLAQG